MSEKTVSEIANEVAQEEANHQAKRMKKIVSNAAAPVLDTSVLVKPSQIQPRREKYLKMLENMQ